MGIVFNVRTLVFVSVRGDIDALQTKHNFGLILSALSDSVINSRKISKVLHNLQNLRKTMLICRFNKDGGF
ncbi:hypothetical protein L596_020196 [Steinernema carpocapsae]|uniref:Uncharacterized protein n=1 Tax=Steinernema carpocapsae TaxID=34508 RepID=A0A4U5MSX3_STECR|nr:hypothetical protein L596_020196 [Steinernema carpocapsae]